MKSTIKHERLQSIHALIQNVIREMAADGV